MHARRSLLLKCAFVTAPVDQNELLWTLHTACPVACALMCGASGWDPRIIGHPRSRGARGNTLQLAGC